MSDALAISPDLCDGGVARWRGMASAGATLRSEAASRVSALRLDDMTTIFPATLAEFDEEMGLSADLLAAVAQRAREADTFDGSYEALGASSVAVDNLMMSVKDGQGASFLDLVDPTAAGDDSQHEVHMSYVPLWGPDGPVPQDVRQGGLGSCAILAAAAGVALDDPEHLQEIITDNGDGSYTVILDGEAVTVDDEFLAGPTNLEYAQNSGVLWPLVLEKAIALHNGGSYEGVAPDGGDPARALEALGFETDGIQLNPSLGRDPADEDVAAAMSTALDGGYAVTANDGGAFGFGIAHAWTVVDVSEVDGTICVTLRNPWGEPGLSDESGSWLYTRGSLTGEEPDFARDQAASSIVINKDAATVRMPIDMFTANFDDIDYVVGPSE